MRTPANQGCSRSIKIDRLPLSDRSCLATARRRLRASAGAVDDIEYFNGDACKVALWFELANPMLGNISPRNMIRAGRYKRLLNFVLDSREAENADTISKIERRSTNARTSCS
jgi:hypothetical protein